MKELKRKVTVIMPVYNCELFVAEAISSILDQTYRDFDLLLIDDGSTDASYEIASSFEDDRLSVISRGNKGLVETLNEGLRLAGGCYIARMDGDDVALPTRLEKQVSLLDTRPNIGICGTGYYSFFDSKRNKIRVHREVDSQRIYDQLIFRPPFGHPTVMFRKCLVDEYSLYYDECYKHCEDYELWSRFLRHTEGANIDEPLLLYRQHASQVSIIHGNDVAGNHARITSRELQDRGVDIPVDFATALAGCDDSEPDLGRFCSLMQRGYSELEAIDIDRRVLKREFDRIWLRACSLKYGASGVVKATVSGQLTFRATFSATALKIVFKSLIRKASP